mmetsp:Transcript_35730/g.48271  ORF Transcript_35730/g.48271 Transcript_35730/m.48271 type:complete len:82 (-) Transcript_35730:378-623(-)
MGHVVDGCADGRDVMMMAWDMASGRKPTLWTETAVAEGIVEDGYETFLRWYGDRLRRMWQLMCGLLEPSQIVVKMKAEDTT